MSVYDGMTPEQAAEEFKRRWGFDLRPLIDQVTREGGWDVEGGTEEEREFVREMLWQRSDQAKAAVDAAWKRWEQIRRNAPDQALPGIIFVDKADISAVVYAAFQAAGDTGQEDGQ